MPLPAMSPNNVAVVTGGASGIGLAAAMRFAKAGMKVCIADLGEARLKEAEAKLAAAADSAANIMISATDVSRVEEVRQTPADFADAPLIVPNNPEAKTVPWARSWLKARNRTTGSTRPWSSGSESCFGGWAGSCRCCARRAWPRA